MYLKRSRKIDLTFTGLNDKNDKKGFMLVESLIGLFLIGSMVLLLIANQYVQLEKLRLSEMQLSNSREQFHQLNAVQFGASVHQGIEIDLSEGRLEDQRNGQVTIFKAY